MNAIRLRGVRVNNLKQIDLDIPHGQWLTICGVSGSGKTSLALDTLYAEGQRRYIESFSPFTRQFLEQLDKPEATSIEGIPPAIAIRALRKTSNRRATIGSATEANEHLRLLYSRIGQASCPNCQTEISRDDPQSAAAKLAQLPAGSRYQIVFPVGPDESTTVESVRRHGFVRVVLDKSTCELSELPPDQKFGPKSLIVVDRLKADSSVDRVRDSLETAFDFGLGHCLALIQELEPDQTDRSTPNEELDASLEIDGRRWTTMGFVNRLQCTQCFSKLPEPEPNLFSFNSALGACENCEGSGLVNQFTLEKIIPNQRLSLREGAIAVWNSPKLQTEFERLIEWANQADVSVDIPYRELESQSRQWIWEGDPRRDFDGVLAFLQDLENRQSKSRYTEFHSKWSTPTPCPTCEGTRLNNMAKSFRVNGCELAELSSWAIDQVVQFLEGFQLPAWQSKIANRILSQVIRRLKYLQQVGVGYLSLDRRLCELSTGEAQRVMLTTSLGSTLINMLYVLDEPTSGLHPDDVEKLIGSIQSLHRRGNTVVCVDHQRDLIGAAERVLEIGPDSGEDGGRIVFDGKFSELKDDPSNLTGQYLSGRRGYTLPESRRTGRGKMKLVGAAGNNLKTIDVIFPLGCLCVVGGVSGSGKSSLVQNTLYPALQQKQQKSVIQALPYQEVLGDVQINEVILIDQSPIGRSPRSNPMTYVKAFDEIRKLFADQMAAKTRNFTAGHFSFNVAKGRCPKCEGDGQLTIDMQFLTDVYVRCDSCRGSRFRSEILEVKYRGKNIAQVLQMAIAKAFSFFRGQPKIQAKLKTLMDVGLGYLPLGQPATTLSTGEAQRLKLALYLNAKTSKRGLFIMDEPTSGLHMADTAKLLETFEALIAVGHSLIVVEHNLQIMQHADWIIELGPGAGESGGTVVATGTPEELANNSTSRIGYHLKQVEHVDVAN